MMLRKVDFNFEEWANLAKHDPVEFNRRRQEILTNCISSAINTNRIASLQCRIDLERIRARTPIKSLLAISSMMWESFDQLNTGLHRFVDYMDDKPMCITPDFGHAHARVISFRQKQRFGA